MDLPQPDDLASLVLRTDFSSEAAWETLQAAFNGSGDYRKGLLRVWVTGSVTRPGGPVWS
ncbi:hypothetical protein [Streptomyces durhamensis]|uniref:hypothetical protein n=1 Tax=Streptomyces durhamensis TaxID=68194 RepID=UPI000B1D5C51|nr:hypothetical protein [Streptomyces durhamensis]